MQDVGLHILELSESLNGGSRIAARVRVSPTPLEDQPKHLLRQGLADAFKTAPRTSNVVRRYRRDPAPLVRSGDGSWRSGKLDAVLAGDFDLLRTQAE
jgi:ATP-dependent Clp protease ATP-binding subunit ClpC